MRFIFISFLLAICFGLSGFFFWKTLPESLDKRDILLGGHVFHVERASRAASRTLGLSGRNGLCDDCGMAFEFEQPGKYGFWMKDMRFPIDIAWIFNDKVVFVKKNFTPDSKEIVIPEHAADTVVEVSAGELERYFIQEGSSYSILSSK